MSRLIWILVLLLAFTIWRTIRGVYGIREWHQINTHSGNEKQPLPSMIYLTPTMWGTVMIGCALARTVQVTREYYAKESYTSFSQLVPVYSGARPKDYGTGVYPSLDRSIIIVEYTVSDLWKNVYAYYAGRTFPSGWVNASAG